LKLNAFIFTKGFKPITTELLTPVNTYNTNVVLPISHLDKVVSYRVIRFPFRLVEIYLSYSSGSISNKRYPVLLILIQRRNTADDVSIELIARFGRPLL